MVQLPEGIRDLPLLKNFQRGYGTHAAFYSMGTVGSFPRDTVADYSPPCGSKAENEHSCTSTTECLHDLHRVQPFLQVKSQLTA